MDAVETQLPSSVSSPQLARAFLRTTLETWKLDGYGDVTELLVTELVANVVTHVGAPMTLRVLRRPSRMRVEIDDASTEVPVVRHPGASDEHGRGVLLVEQLANAWGVEKRADGKTVWFEVRTPGAESLNGHARLSRSPRGDRELLSRSWRRVRLAPALRGADENGRQGVEALVDSRVLARLTPSVRDAITVAASTR